MRNVALWALVSLLCSGTSSAQTPIRIAVSPQITQGFVDTDAGVQDSIADIKKLLKAVSGVRLVDANAQVTLIVLRREMAVGGMTTSVGGATRSTFGGTHPVIHSLISVGAYTKPLQSEVADGLTWKITAKQVVKDLMVWIDANRDRLK